MAQGDAWNGSTCCCCSSHLTLIPCQHSSGMRWSSNYPLYFSRSNGRQAGLNSALLKHYPGRWVALAHPVAAGILSWHTHTKVLWMNSLTQRTASKSLSKTAQHPWYLFWRKGHRHDHSQNLQQQLAVSPTWTWEKPFINRSTDSECLTWWDHGRTQRAFGNDTGWEWQIQLVINLVPWIK